MKMIDQKVQTGSISSIYISIGKTKLDRTYTPTTTDNQKFHTRSTRISYTWIVQAKLNKIYILVTIEDQICQTRRTYFTHFRIGQAQPDRISTPTRLYSPKCHAPPENRNVLNSPYVYP